MIRGFLIFVAGLVVGMYFTSAHASPRATTTSKCHVTYSDGLPGPDDACTPGSYAHLTTAQACASKLRPDTKAATREKVLTRYGVPGWNGRDGELDHRLPFWMGGRTTAKNLWPEPGHIPNLKDKLEYPYLWRRVCVAHTMRLRTARALFLGDWRVAYRKYEEEL